MKITMIDEEKIQYNKQVKRLEVIKKEIEELESDSTVQKYLKLLNTKKFLESNNEQMYITIKHNEYRNCNHIWINNRSYCIKCRLKNILAQYEYVDYYGLSFDEKICMDYILYNSLGNDRSISLNVNCDIALANEIYDIIAKSNENKSDEEICAYFKKILVDKTNPLSLSRKK
ncbi:MAG: hypothetical protein IJ572_05215 [Bacilli bacterium]|nr:hypothetical protein [Bacilli bacterium]